MPMSVTKLALITGSVAKAVGGMQVERGSPQRIQEAAFILSGPTAGSLIQKILPPVCRGQTPARGLLREDAEENLTLNLL